MVMVDEHRHPLKLVNLHPEKNIEEESEDEEEEEELINPADELFRCGCNRCGLEITTYHRYYYKCLLDDYSLHQFCAQLPPSYKHPSHPHSLTLGKKGFEWTCVYCQTQHTAGEVGYHCTKCELPSCYSVDVKCAVEAEKMKIHHPSHPHPLLPLISNPILCFCVACGKEHKGVFFLCTTCSNFAIHNDCAFLPKKLLVQHTHPLTLSYSFLQNEQISKFNPTCRVCGDDFDHELLWIYKCEKCMYYAHLDCATSSCPGKNYEDADYPDFLHLPFPDESYSIPKHLFSKETGPTALDEVISLQHIHQHKLKFVNDPSLGPSSSSNINSYMCHDPMKKVQLLCNACLRPITSFPFYKCNEENSCSNFALHEWCTLLPTKIENHPGHPQHTLVLMPNVASKFFSVFRCGVCRLNCNGFAYGCVECECYVDVTCGFIPENITHKSHPNHLLSRVYGYNQRCHMCRFYAISGSHFGFGCSICGVFIHVECALLLAETTRHKYDEHPLHLSYLPIENHKSEYFCEICEYQMNPHRCFYHCPECAQSVHAACAPLILECETYTTSNREWYNIYLYLNVKFGGILHNTSLHQHPLSFAQGIESDGRCSMCDEELQFEMIFKCHQCKIAIDYECCTKHLSK